MLFDIGKVHTNPDSYGINWFVMINMKRICGVGH